MKNSRARALLLEHGCRMDGDNLEIPPELVNACLKTAPSDFTIYDRNKRPAMEIGARSGRSYFLPGMCNVYRIDLETGERRLSVRKDAHETGILVEYLPNIDAACGLTLISDCDQNLAAATEVRELLETTTKPILLMTTNILEIETSYKMCCEVAGGEEEFKKYPFAIGGADSSSPLTHNEKNVDTLMYMFEKGIPSPYVAAPMIGATAPVTIAGAVALGIADNLVGLVLSQIINPGTAFLGSCFVDYMDMATTSFAMTAPEIILGSAASVDVYHYLGLPCVCHMGMTDSPLFDQQLAMDYTAQLYTSMLSGTDISFFSGFQETARTGSLEALYFANDLIGYLDRVIGGLEVTDETLALVVIHEVGPGGNFLMEEHTLDHFRKNWVPDTIARINWTDFVSSGKRDYGKRVNEKIRDILKEGIREPLPLKVLEQLDAILSNAENMEIRG